MRIFLLPLIVLLGLLTVAFSRLLGASVRWIDEHNAFMTAIATAAIAWLTWSIVTLTHQQTRDTEAIQRAFVFSTGVKFYKPDQNAFPGLAMVVVPIENAGTTSATELDVVTNMFTEPVTEQWPIPFDFPDPQPKRPGKDPLPRVLGPKETTLGPISLLEPECLDLIASGELKMLVWGRIKYKDAFGEGHRTYFCWQYVGLGLDYPQGTTPITLFFPCPWHNCTDDDCNEWPDKRRAQYYEGRCRRLSSQGSTPTPPEPSPVPSP